MSEPSFDRRISIRHDLRPGDVGYITYLHGILYADQGWDHTFDAYVAIPLAEFARSPSPGERIWIVEDGERIVGSVAIVKFTRERGSAPLAAPGPGGAGPWDREEARRRGSGFQPGCGILIGVSLDGEYAPHSRKALPIRGIQADGGADA